MGYVYEPDGPGFPQFSSSTPGARCVRTLLNTYPLSRHPLRSPNLTDHATYVQILTWFFDPQFTVHAVSGHYRRTWQTSKMKNRSTRSRYPTHCSNPPRQRSHRCRSRRLSHPAAPRATSTRQPVCTSRPVERSRGSARGKVSDSQVSRWCLVLAVASA